MHEPQTPEQQAPEEQAPEEEPLHPNLRAAVQELEDYLADESDERRAELVLPFASRWILLHVGLDIARLREEAETFVAATPFGDRILRNYDDQVTYWISQRMLVVGDEQIDLEQARDVLALARAELAERAELLDAEGFPLVAGGFRAILEESAGDSPPADILWNALARRLAETVCSS